MSDYKSENVILYDYLFANLNSINCFTEKSANYLTEMMSGSHGKPFLAPFDSPDILVLLNDKTLMLEHFQFDSSERKNGGSLLQAEKNIFIKSNTTKKFNVTQIKNDSLITYYITNLMESTIKHHDKFHEYLKNVSKKQGIIYDGIRKVINQEHKEFGLVIEDNSLDYNMFLNKLGIYEYITCFHIKEFRDFLRGHMEVEHIFHLVVNSTEKRIVYYFHNSSEDLNLLDEIMEYKSPNLIEKADIFFWTKNKI